MTGANLATAIRRKTKTTSTTLTDAEMLPIVNTIKDRIATMITKKSENYFIIPTLFDLVASGTSREYAWPDDVLNNIISLELAFTSALSYVPANPFNFNYFLKNYGALTEGNITANFSNENPFYFMQRRAITVLSGTVIAVTNGGRLRYRAYPADLANVTGTTDLALDPTTTTFGVPKQFHELWADGVSAEWKQGRPKPIPLSRRELLWDEEMKARLGELQNDDTRAEIFGSLPQTTQEGSNGQNL